MGKCESHVCLCFTHCIVLKRNSFLVCARVCASGLRGRIAQQRLWCPAMLCMALRGTFARGLCAEFFVSLLCAALRGLRGLCAGFFLGTFYFRLCFVILETSAPTQSSRAWACILRTKKTVMGHRRPCRKAGTSQLYVTKRTGCEK